MKKLLLLASCISLIALLLSCQTPTTISPKSNLTTITTSANLDSISKSKVVIQQDTTKAINNTSVHSDKQSTKPNPTNSSTQGKMKPTETKRIEHGSDNQAKLDSIKTAKLKLKNK
jgi:hypothetical protein